MGASRSTAQADALTGGAASGSATLHDVSSEELAWRAKQGCQAAFAELVDRYAPRLQAFLGRRTRDRHEVEDLVQDTLIKAYQNLDRYQDSWRFSTWLFTIAGRLAISRHRGRGNPRSLPDTVRPVPEWGPPTRNDALGSPVCPCEAPDEILDRREQRESLWAVAAELPGRQYEALWLKYGEDMSIKEIARTMGKSQVCIKVLLYRARVALGQRLEKRDLTS